MQEEDPQPLTHRGVTKTEAQMPRETKRTKLGWKWMEKTKRLVYRQRHLHRRSPAICPPFGLDD